MADKKSQKRWRYKHGISKRPQLTESERSAIMEMRAGKMTHQQIAHIMNRSIECVARVIRGKKREAMTIMKQN